MKRRIELTLLLTGVSLLGNASWKIFKYETFQKRAAWSSVSRGTLPPLPEPFGLLRAAGPTIRILGRLEIPRLRVSVSIIEGDDEVSLDLGVAHVPGTAPIGAAGNVVIAGHRDTTFRALRRVKVGDQIRLESDQTYSYIVDTLQIVDPDDLRILQSSGNPILTLITCYPFHFIGDAPKRYVIQAKRFPA